MAAVLGKRKRRDVEDEAKKDVKSTQDQSEYQEAMRRHFEASFEPVQNLLPATGSSSSSSEVVKADDDSESDLENSDSQSDWSGISDPVEVQVVSHERIDNSQDMETIKSQRKQFMSSKPPTRAENATKDRSKAQASQTKDIKTASSLTAEDLALQRLLAESHLLSGSTTSTLLPSLKARQAAQDLRLQSLGAKKSIQVLGAGNTPMAVRKGIENKKSERERGRRRDAKEAGIVLEHESRSSTDARKRRKRSGDVGAPAVGKWRGGTLVLGKKDVAEIEGQRLASDFGKKNRGGKKGKRR